MNIASGIISFIVRFIKNFLQKNILNIIAIFSFSLIHILIDRNIFKKNYLIKYNISFLPLLNIIQLSLSKLLVKTIYLSIHVK